MSRIDIFGIDTLKELGTALEFGDNATRGVNTVFAFGICDARVPAFSFGGAFLVAPGGNAPPLFEIGRKVIGMLTKQQRLDGLTSQAFARRPRWLRGGVPNG